MDPIAMERELRRLRRERTNEELQKLQLLEEMEKLLRENELLVRGRQNETERSQLIRSGMDSSREQGSLYTMDYDRSDYEESVPLVVRESAGRTCRGSQHYVGDEGSNRHEPMLRVVESEKPSFMRKDEYCLPRRRSQSSHNQRSIGPEVTRDINIDISQDSLEGEQVDEPFATLDRGLRAIDKRLHSVRKDTNTKMKEIDGSNIREENIDRGYRMRSIIQTEFKRG